MAQTTEADRHPSPLLLAMTEKLRPYGVTDSQDEPSSICRIPLSIRDGDPRSYEPGILSIGPYHHGDPKLLAMEEHKWRYLHNLLVRGGRSDSTEVLQECIEKVRGSEARARRYYSEDTTDLGSDGFVEMMVLDGCFILELLLRSQEAWEDDPVIDVGWVWNLVRRDILKLENQIPFFILEDLLKVVMGLSVADSFLRELAFSFLMSRQAVAPLTGHRVYHLLHFYDSVLLPTSRDASSINKRPSSSYVRSVLKKIRRYTFRSRTLRSRTDPCVHVPSPRSQATHKRPKSTIPCAVQLGEVGIKLGRKSAESFLDVSFHDGWLDIPFVTIEDATNSVFRNLIALEQCCPELGNHFTWYVNFLDCIVNTPKDVAILQQRGIIENMLGSEEEVAQVINQLCKEVTIHGTCPYFDKVFNEVNQHCQSKWRKHRARLMREYFSNPWSIISLVAAIALLLLTAAQVILAVLSYRKQ